MFGSSLRAIAAMDSTIAVLSRSKIHCTTRRLSYFDVAFNMTDDMFNGVYFGKTRHPPDMHCVLKRADEANVTHILATPGSLSQLKETLDMSKAHDNIFVTAGVHPTRCREFEENGNCADDYLAELKHIILSNPSKVVAVGECGLDYARTEFCDKETQMKYFLRQLNLAKEVGLPLYLHSRDTAGDFCRVMSTAGGGIGGIVHSFDGSADEASELLQLGLYIGINGCSLRTDQNIEVVKNIPLERIVAETDAPWCGIKPTHASFQHLKSRLPVVKAEKYTPGDNSLVKDRNEPCGVLQVVEVIASIKGIEMQEVAEKVYANAFSALRLNMPDKV